MRKKLLTYTGGAVLLLTHSLSQATTDLPPTAKVEMGQPEEVCSNFTAPEWRKEQVIDGVAIQASNLCNPDNPAD
ncbi:MAG: copper oxidase, partial [Methylovulum sp.]|nr:copper oxidase [Methylovulum sp.]